MAKIKITETNGASAKDISDAIGRFLTEYEKTENSNTNDIDEIEKS